MDVYILTTSKDQMTHLALEQISVKNSYNYVSSDMRVGYCADILIVVDQAKLANEEKLRQVYKSVIHTETRIVHVIPGGRNDEYESGYHVMGVFEGNFVKLLEKDIPLFVESLDVWMREGKDPFSQV